MLEDVNAWLPLINHLLDAARLDQKPTEDELREVELCRCCRIARHGLPTLSPAGKYRYA